jgi:hypothetical protein
VTDSFSIGADGLRRVNDRDLDAIMGAHGSASQLAKAQLRLAARTVLATVGTDPQPVEVFGRFSDALSGKHSVEALPTESSGLGLPETVRGARQLVQLLNTSRSRVRLSNGIYLTLCKVTEGTSHGEEIHYQRIAQDGTVITDARLHLDYSASIH